MAATWILTFILAFGELGVSLLVAPPGESTLPIRVYTLIANAPSSQVAALALLQATVGSGSGRADWERWALEVDAAVYRRICRFVSSARRFGSRLVLDGLSLDVAQVGSSSCSVPAAAGRRRCCESSPDSISRTLAKSGSPDGRSLPPAATWSHRISARSGSCSRTSRCGRIMTVEQQLDFVLASGGIPSGARRARTQAVLALARIEPLAPGVRTSCRAASSNAPRWRGPSSAAPSCS